MVDENVMQIFTQKIVAAQEASEKASDKFLEILYNIDEFYSNVNGYPAQTIEMIKDINQRLDNIETAVLNIPTDDEINRRSKILYWNYIIYFLLAIFGSFLGTIFHGLMFHS